MINIILNYDMDQVEIEGYAPITFTQLDRARELIIKLLHKAYYSGESLCLESLCLEEKRDNKYQKLERW